MYIYIYIYAYIYIHIYIYINIYMYTCYIKYIYCGREASASAGGGCVGGSHCGDPWLDFNPLYIYISKL